MIERLEVAPGPGTVIRYGNVVAWAAAAASSSLISFLTESARNLAPSPVGGDQLADHLVGVLSRRDPEPHVPFVALGPTEDGWTALLHGPVQVWDGANWTVPSPEPGWLRSKLSPRPALAVSVSGTAVPAPSPDSMWDLEAGVVPGGGFLLVPAVPAAGVGPLPFAVPSSSPAPAEETTVIPLPDAGPPTEVLPNEPVPEAATGEKEAETEAAAASAPEQGLEDADGTPEPAAETRPEPPPAEPEPELPEGGEVPELVTGGEEGWSDIDTAVVVAASPPAAVMPAAPAPPGVLDLRSAEARARVVPYPPLPPSGDPPRPVPGAPVVAGVPCPRGHLNRPGMPSCARCGRPIGDHQGNQVSGTRPALGCLITDEGSVYRLDSGYLIGSEPDRDPTVRGRLARPLTLPGVDVAASHAEIRLHDWDVVVTDRASEGGTHVFEPGAAAWERVRPYEPRVLPPGTHIAFGQRVVTFVTPWTVRTSAGAGGHP